jgi:hypothetical protein
LIRASDLPTIWKFFGKNIPANRRAVADEEQNLKVAPSGQKAAGLRNRITSDALQQIVAKAVRDSDAMCAGFIGIIIEHTNPKLNVGANWTLKGIKYG